ncbi:MAG: 16S rRNA (cytosine(967)-C(5))-methyltransferase RsmB [Magnetococcales bacterium]|nr:16S rRNA (cytosine(967)-C(5))-methyltransferase RsmB [Magnetococcales bacterium]
MNTGPRGRAVLALMQVMHDGMQLRGHDWLQGLSVRDKGLAREIALGSLRHHSLLNAMVSSCMSRPLPAKRHFIKAVLVTALYQTMFLRIPARAAVFEAITLVKNSRERAMASFCNAVLRQAVSKDQSTILNAIADPMERLAVATSFPLWLVKRWWEREGELECRRRLEAGNRPAPLTLRLHGDPPAREITWKQLLEAGAKRCPDTPDALIWDAGGRVEDLPGYDRGTFAVADQGAQWIPRLLHPQPGDRILDACAAPGGKTAHLADLARQSGAQVQLTALDKSQARLQRLRENLRRLRIQGVEIVAGDMTDPGLLDGRTFDRVLVDAPCTGTGIIRRHPDIKWLRKPEDPARMQQEQLAILKAAAPRVAAGGILVYATCSMESEENQEVVNRFLADHPQWRHDPVSLQADGLDSGWITPHGAFQTRLGISDMDGFFAARLVRLA